MNEKEFIDNIKKIGIKLTDEQIKQFQMYYKLLIEWNNKMNLTTINKKEDVYLKHFYDSATLVCAIDLEKQQNFCDVGSGAGFPGVVIKILFPNLEVTLVDSLQKRIIFLNEVINKLKLKKIYTIHARAEEFGRKNKDRFDVVTARAVAPLNILLEYCIPIVKKEKFFIAMKANISREIFLSKKAIKKINTKIKEVIEFKLPIENSQRALIVVQKKGKTPNIYPRDYAKIKKEPL